MFGELDGGKVVQKGVYAKKGIGEMVRFMAGIRAEAPELRKRSQVLCDLVHDQKNSSGDTEPQSCFIFLFLYTYRERLASIDPLDLHNTQPSSAVITLSTDASMLFSVTSGLKYNK